MKITNAGFTVTEWFEEQAVSGSIRALDRPVFSKLVSEIEAGSTVISVSLDRLGRDTEDVLHTIRKFHEKGVKLRLMDLDGVDLTSQTGKMLVTLLSLVAEMERDKCISRSAAGVAKARDENKVFGRYLKIEPTTLAALIAKRQDGCTLDQLAAEYKLDRCTISQTVNKWKDNWSEYVVVFQKQREQPTPQPSQAHHHGKL